MTEQERGSQGGTGPQTGAQSLDARALRRALAANAVGTAVNASGAWLPLTARQAVADAVLAAIEPTLEHCIHDRAVCDQHHRAPVPGCPFPRCSETGSGTDDVPTPEGTL